MDILFSDPSEVPLPPDEVRIRQLKAIPIDDRRVHVYLEVDPSLKPPNADLLIRDEQGNSLASASIIESIQNKMDIVMHLRGASPGCSCTLQAYLFFATLPEPDQEFTMPGESGFIHRLDVDQAKIEFNLLQW